MLFSDFDIVKKVDKDIIDKYTDILPKEILDIWRNYGFGSFLNGYLKVINPDEYFDILNQSYFRADVSIPIFTTGLGDIINFEKGKYINIVKYRRGDFYIIPTAIDFLFSDLENMKFCNKHLDWNQYLEAIKVYGIPNYDECFGYVPLLGMGGTEKVENLQKVKLKEHIMVICEFMGQI